MILMGDEVRRTQHGNNNAYCQDNETSWFDWTLLAKHADVHRFVKLLIARRLLRDVEHERRRVSLNQLLREAKQSLAWRKTRAAGLEPLLAQPGIQRGSFRSEGSALPPDPERLLGAARLRAATGRRRRTSYGADGSILLSTRRTTSSNGKQRHRFRAEPTRPGRAPWWCLSRSWGLVEDGPGGR